MKKLMLMLAAVGVGALAQPSFGQPAAPQGSSAASPYSPPTEKHAKKPKGMKHGKKKAGSAAGASE